ncbi:uncharacterized protein LOC122254335 isoform X3 [Penaeus japonicus]|uniref:uncharacterized protein LOC122254335 isoform X3 n=1 Tax=Penaeus japonicus TaxID=27405 RepID=UPI001C716D6B|nr:uncharacterized protein LOC122254335 isoform X3 [Penaeus japonicus]
MSVTTQVWMLAVEAVLLVMLWVMLAGLQIATVVVGFLDIASMIQFVVGFSIFLIISNALLNGWLLRIYWGLIQKPLAAVLFFTFTTPLYMLFFRIRHVVAALRTKNQLDLRREALMARYAVSKAESELVQLSSFSATVKRTSCVAHLAETPTEDSLVDSEALPRSWFVTDTHFDVDTKMIKMSEGCEGRREARSLVHLLTVDLFELVASRKTLSYHFVLNSSGDILHISSSSILASGLPPRLCNTSPLTVCNDVHYMINMSRGIGYEIVYVQKRSEKSRASVSHLNLSLLIWNNVLYITALLAFGTVLNIEKSHGSASALFHTSWILSAFAWLLTCRSVDEPWSDTFAKMPLRLCFTISRIFLVCTITLSGLAQGVLVFLSIKASGYLALASQIVYAKLRRNVDLWGSVVDRYCFEKSLVFSSQMAESVVSCVWAICWHACCPSERSLVLLVVLLLCHAFGMVWLCFVGRFLEEPLKNPLRVLQIAKDRIKWGTGEY